jgi:hypothetical protein
MPGASRVFVCRAILLKGIGTKVEFAGALPGRYDSFNDYSFIKEETALKWPIRS